MSDAVATWPAVWRQTHFRELVKEPASPRFRFKNDATECERNILVDWGGLPQAAHDFLGFPLILGSPGNPYLSRVTPHTFPEVQDLSGSPYLYCTQFTSAAPWGIPLGANSDVTQPAAMRSVNNVAVYRYARVQLLYETLTYNVKEDSQITQTAGVPDESNLERYVTKVVRPAASYLTLPPGAFKMVTSGTPAAPGQPGRITPGYDVDITWHQVPEAAVGMKLINPGLANPSVDLALGCVNSASALGSPAGTVLLTAAEARPIRSALGMRLFDVHYRFRVFNPSGSVGHNHVYWPGPTPAPGYYEVSTDGATNLVSQTPWKSIYNFANFALLFRVPT